MIDKERIYDDIGNIIQSDEKIIWAENPHSITLLPVIFTTLFVLVGTVYLTFFFDLYDLSYYPLMLNVLTFVALLYKVWYRRNHMYIITTNKAVEKYGVLFSRQNPIKYNRIVRSPVNRNRLQYILNKITKIVPGWKEFDVANIVVSTAEDQSGEITFYNIPGATAVSGDLDKLITGAGENMGRYDRENLDIDVSDQPLDSTPNEDNEDPAPLESGYPGEVSQGNDTDEDDLLGEESYPDSTSEDDEETGDPLDDIFGDNETNEKEETIETNRDMSNEDSVEETGENDKEEYESAEKIEDPEDVNFRDGWEYVEEDP